MHQCRLLELSGHVVLCYLDQVFRQGLKDVGVLAFIAVQTFGRGLICMLSLATRATRWPDAVGCIGGVTSIRYEWG